MKGVLTVEYGYRWDRRQVAFYVFNVRDEIMKLRELGFKEILKVLGWYFVWSFFFWLFGYFTLVEIVVGNGLELFRLGNLPVPSKIHSSNIEVMIFYTFVCIALAIGFYLRYVTYGEEIQFKKQFNIKDERKFSDDLSDIGSSDGGGGD